MNPWRVPGSPRRARALVVSMLLAATGAGCASSGMPLPNRPTPGQLVPGSPLLSRTLPEGDAWLRQYVMSGDHDAALTLLRRSSARPRDRLLRSLQEAVVLHHGGRHAESNRIFEWAEQEADRRYTRSVTRGLGSLLINDMVLAYSPSVGELAIIPYYRMLNYLALGDLPGAVVEARKSGATLARLDGRRVGPCQHFGLVQYLAGQVYAAAGERNDALVSLRQAEHSFNTCSGRGQSVPAGFGADLLGAALALGLHDEAEEVAERFGLDLAHAEHDAGMGDVFVLVEHGFAAHRAQQDIYVPLYSDEVGDRESDPPSALEVAGRVSTRIAASLLAGPEAQRLWDEPVWNLAPHSGTGRSALSRAEVAHVLRLSWPVMRLEASRAPATRVVVDGQAFDATALDDVSARLVHDLESRRTSILTRMVARGIVRYVAAREVEEQTERKWEGLGRLLRIFTNTAANALEQADTRSWSLLPDQISLARLRLPAGERQVRLEVIDAVGAVNRIVDLGTVEVRPGERVFLSHRVWGADPGDRERLIRLGIDLYGQSAPPASVAGPRRAGPQARQQPRSRPVPTHGPGPITGTPPLPVPAGSPPPATPPPGVPRPE
jgi:uncharacterized protein